MSRASRVNSLVLWLISFAVVGCGKDPQRVSYCHLKKDPAAYNHKLIELTAFVKHGFEDFTLFDPECPSWPQVWLEYGGTVSSGTMYCCGVTADRGRPKPLVVEDVPIPLVDDAHFRDFDRLLQRGGDTMVRATIVGRFFSGRQESLPGGAAAGGYGHMGCCSLLAIQRVLSVDPQDRADLDYRASADSPKIGKVGCGYRYLVDVDSTPSLMAAQHQAEHGQSQWAFVDPQRVASDFLARFLKIDATAIKGLRQTGGSQGQVLYEWEPKGKRTKYLVVASRPYWLSFYAKDPQRVAWVIVGAYESFCN